MQIISPTVGVPEGRGSARFVGVKGESIACDQHGSREDNMCVRTLRLRCCHAAHFRRLCSSSGRGELGYQATFSACTAHYSHWTDQLAV